MRAVVAAAVASILSGAVLATVPATAHADPVDDMPGGVHVLALESGPAGPRITVTLSNGYRSIITPCRFEDGRRCYWQANVRGNGIGSSFLVVKGVRYYIDMTGFDPLA